MKSLNSPISLDYRPNELQKGPTSSRAEIVALFVEKLNQARQGTKFKPVTPRQVAVKLAHVPERDLYPFYKECSGAKSFSAFFWWSLRPERG
jgi:hypothetical protein